MSKRLFISLVVLMSLSLIGIILVQGYWIKTSVDSKEEQFSQTINQALIRVSEKIRDKEQRDFIAAFDKLKDSIGEPQESQIRDIILFADRDESTDQVFIYSHGVLEEEYNITASFFDKNLQDSATVKDLKSIRTRTTYAESGSFDEMIRTMTPIEKIKTVERLASMEKAIYEEAFLDMVKSKPVHKRLNKTQLELLLSREFMDLGIDIDFGYGVYSNGLATKVKSADYKPIVGVKQYVTPLFVDSKGKSNFDLVVSFPEKKKFLMSQIFGMALLSVILTLIIVITYSSALYQLIRQKQISEIKSDFINNMTHEFKTPIATINLALDAIKNPKVVDDREKVKRYLGMIRDENKRMHAQVENVLRISKLEKNQLDISKDRVRVHDIIGDAIDHVSLIVENRNGYIHTKLDAFSDEVLANDMHMTNVLVNILDNAIKYSPDVPKIDVETENIKNNILIKIEDQGSGMNKAVVKRIFEKFYREHTGNIHNVKGHGLGLAYVKKIIEDHQGEVYAESEKGVGSTFYIKLPLI